MTLRILLLVLKMLRSSQLIDNQQLVIIFIHRFIKLVKNQIKVKNANM